MMDIVSIHVYFRYIFVANVHVLVDSRVRTYVILPCIQGGERGRARVRGLCSPSGIHACVRVCVFFIVSLSRLPRVKSTVKPPVRAPHVCEKELPVSLFT